MIAAEDPPVFALSRPRNRGENIFEGATMRASRLGGSLAVPGRRFWKSTIH
jgi:hypothetical protein